MGACPVRQPVALPVIVCFDKLGALLHADDALLGHAVIFNAFRPHCVKIFRTFIDFLNGRMLTHFVIFSFRFFGFDEAVAPARSPHVLLSDAVDAANIRVGYDLSAFSIHQIASSSFQYMSA